MKNYKGLILFILCMFLIAIQSIADGQNISHHILSSTFSNKYKIDDLQVSKKNITKTRQLKQRLKFAYLYDLDTLINDYTSADSLEYFYNGTKGFGNPIYFQQSYISYFLNTGDIELPMIDFHNPNSDSIYTVRKQPANSPIPRLIFLKKYDSIGRNISWERKYFDYDSNKFITNGKYIYDYDNFGYLSYIAEMKLDSITNDFTDTSFCIVYQNMILKKDTVSFSYEFINGVKIYLQKVEQEFNSIGNLIKRKTFVNLSSSSTAFIPIQKDSVIYFADSFLIFNSYYDTSSLNYNLNLKMICKLNNNSVDSIYSLGYNQIDSTFSNYSLETIDRNTSGFSTKYSFFWPDSALNSFILNFYHTYLRDSINRIIEYKNYNAFPILLEKKNYEYVTDSLIDSVSTRLNNYSIINVAKFNYENFDDGIASNTFNLQSNVLDCKLFPNPVSKSLFLLIESKQNRPLKINIYSSLGTLLKNESYNTNIGDNLFNMYVGSLTNGIYLVELISGNERITKTISICK